jgi:hypothetical protein
MRKVRMLLILVVLSLTAVPSFGLICGYCDPETAACTFDAYAGSKCNLVGPCRDYAGPECGGFAPAKEQRLAARWTLASVEIAPPQPVLREAAPAVQLADASLTKQ